MASWADSIGRGYGVGRTIGDDISRMRYGKAEERVRDKYAALAAEEGKTLQDYLPQMEEELRGAGRGMFGADRRGVIGADRQSLSGGALGRLRDEVMTAGERRAGALMLEDKQEESRMSRAGTLAALGRYDDAQQQQIAGKTIGATTRALGPAGPNGEPGVYDPAKGALGMAQVNAQHGNQAGAERDAAAGQTFRMQQANVFGGQLATMFQNPDQYTNDQIAGMYAALAENVPELLGHTRMQVGDDGKWYIYANGSEQATGSFDPGSGEDQQELLGMLNSFTRDPSKVVSDYQQARLAQITEEKTRRNEIDTDFRKAEIDVAKGLAETAGISGDIASKIIRGSSGSGSGGGGFKLDEVGSEPNTYIVSKGDKVYVAKTNVAPDPTKGELGGTVQWFEADGETPVAATAMSAAERRDATEYVTSIAGELAKGDYALKAQAVKNSLETLRALRADHTGDDYTPPQGGALGRRPRGERNNNTGNIEDRGQFKGMPGYLGSDGRFARFETPEQGQQAHHRQLQRYMRGEGVAKTPRTTVQDIVGLWSPVSDPGNAPGSTDNYARYVAQRLGVDPGAQLSESDIPRLAQAMGEFETGNTQRGVIAADAPAAPKPGNALGVPEAKAPTQLARISPDRVRGDAQSLNAAADDFRAKRDAYERFVRDNGRGKGVIQGSAFTAAKVGGSTRQTYSDPAVQRVHDQLKQQMEEAEQQLVASTDDIRRDTRALRGQTERADMDKRAGALAAKYDPGMSDVFARLPD